MKKRYSHHKGISLFELLIVIALIVILSSAFILSSINTSASGDAAKIIANLTTIKQAATSWYADHRDTVREMNKKQDKIQENETYVNEIAKYLDNPTIKLNVNKGNAINEGTYGIFNVHGYRTTWYVGYKLTLDEQEDVKDKLAGKKEILGLHFSGKYPNPNNLAPDGNEGDSVVWMHILGDLTATNWNND